jgi:hypothetical protein
MATSDAEKPPSNLCPRCRAPLDDHQFFTADGRPLPYPICPPRQ